MKKHAFLSTFARLFTRGVEDAYAAIPFKSAESFGDEAMPALAAPAFWSHEAIAVMAEAACPAIPAALRAVEENTVPSWLWRHKAAGTNHVTEGDLRDIFNRVVGSAGAKAWKLGLFSNEKNARAFYDEARYALMQRHIAITPEIIAPMGLDWVYGIDAKPAAAKRTGKTVHKISNAEIDGMLGKTKHKTDIWKKIFAVKGKQETAVSVRLSDIAGDWHSTSPAPAQAAIDVMQLRHNDGSVNSDALKQVVRLLVIILDLHERNDVTIGVANIAPLLMALGLGYDSDAGRAMAASIAALVTAEGLVASAEMAALRGADAVFADERDAIMRGLRNHRRAVYGDANDYEKLSVLPASLPLKNCPDLALVAEAQRQWDEALVLARVYGLRRLSVTDMTPNAALAMTMESASQGLAPLHGLTMMQQNEDDCYVAVLHPAVGEALARLDYSRDGIKTLGQHIAGTHSLHAAPAVNHRSLRNAGLSASVIENIEAYIPCVNSIRLAITPWVVGVDFCKNTLKISAKKIESPRFDLLAHLGFDEDAVKAADAFCYGHNTARNARILNIRHRALFACGAEISTEARLRMAASVQSFISCDTGADIALPVAGSVARGTEMVLAAWQRGLKSLKIVFDPTVEAPIARSGLVRRLTAKGHVAAKTFKTPVRLSHGGKSHTALSIKKSTGARRGTQKH